MQTMICYSKVSLSITFSSLSRLLTSELKVGAGKAAGGSSHIIPTVVTLG